MNLLDLRWVMVLVLAVRPAFFILDAEIAVKHMLIAKIFNKKEMELAYRLLEDIEKCEYREKERQES